jgi:hypothetical protein
VTAEQREDLRFAAVVVLVLAVIGAVLGLVWAAWSPPGPAAAVFGGGKFEPEDNEAFVAGDGRFLVIAAAAGLVAGLIVWRRVGRRGPLVALALGVGGLLGALLTELLGHVSGGGSFTGKRFPSGDGTTHEITAHLPLSLHAQGLLFVEPALAALVYGLLVAFAVRDDLGRPDPARDARLAAASVDAGHHPQDGGGYGDAPRALQEGYLPPQ